VNVEEDDKEDDDHQSPDVEPPQPNGNVVVGRAGVYLYRISGQREDDYGIGKSTNLFARDVLCNVSGYVTSVWRRETPSFQVFHKHPLWSKEIFTSPGYLLDRLLKPIVNWHTSRFEPLLNERSDNLRFIVELRWLWCLRIIVGHGDL
jgi:hypothetical protein